MNSDTQTKLFTAMVRLWLVAIVISIGCVIYFVIIRDSQSSLFFFCLFLISAVQYLMRKRQRKKHLEYLKFKEDEKSRAS